MKKITSLLTFIALAITATAQYYPLLKYDFSYGLLSNKGTITYNSILTQSGTAPTTVPDRAVIDDRALDISNGTILTSPRLDSREKSNETWTLSFWLKSPNTSSTQSAKLFTMHSFRPIINQEGFEISINSGSNQSISLWNGLYGGNGKYRGFTNTANTPNLLNNTWQHIVVRGKELPSGDSVVVSIVLNNREIKNDTFGFPGLISRWVYNASMTINTDSKYYGIIDDVNFYDEYLSISKITTLHSINPTIPKIIYVNEKATGANTGESWSNAYINPQSAFNNMNDGDEVWIAKGKYIPQNQGRNSSFVWTKEHIKVYGGFSGNGTETNISERNWLANPTILSGDLDDDGDVSNNCYSTLVGPYADAWNKRILYAKIDGIIIQDGNANSTSTAQKFGRYGGGSSITFFTEKIDFKNCTWRNNQATGGGAVCVSGDNIKKDISFVNCRFSNNSARTGAPFYVSTDQKEIKLKMQNCLIDNNEVIDFNSKNGIEGHGGTIVEYNGGIFNVDINNCTWVGNKDNSSSASKRLVAVYKRFNRLLLGNHFVNLKNCIFSDNDHQDSNFTFNPVTNNSAYRNLNLDNVLFEDTASIGLATGKNSIITGNAQFIDLSNKNYRLKSTSPAIDKGDTIGMGTILTDLGGFRRVMGSKIDLGCFEYGTALSNKKLTTQAIKIYPNPAQNALKVLETDRIISTQIINLQGQTLLQQNTASNKMDISHLPKGLYVIKITTALGTQTSKFIKN